MVWTINYSDRALKSLRKMDKQNARRIVDFMSLRIAVAADPRQSGKPLKGELGEFWRYRVGDYRVLCEIRDDELVTCRHDWTSPRSLRLKPAMRAFLMPTTGIMVNTRLTTCSTVCRF